MPARALAAVSVGFQMHLFILMERHSRSMNMLSMKRPRPSIEIATPAAAAADESLGGESGALIGIEIQGFPNRSSASSSAAAEARIVGVRQPPCRTAGWPSR